MLERAQGQGVCDICGKIQPAPMWAMATRGSIVEHARICNACLRALKTEIGELVKKGELPVKKRAVKQAWVVMGDNDSDYDNEPWVDSVHATEDSAKKRIAELDANKSDKDDVYTAEPYELLSEA